jgi:hypothetical protein
MDRKVADFSDKIMRQNNNLEQGSNSIASDFALNFGIFASMTPIG